ncbi:MAG: 3-dehydroquinate synthase [Planctomycetaceae bacterium]
MASTASSETVHVDLGYRSYDIVIGQSLLADSARQFREWLSITNDDPLWCMVVTDEIVHYPYAVAVENSLKETVSHVGSAIIVPGEKSKSLEQASRLYDELVTFGADRQTVVVAVGGGVVGDLAGYVAATYARGLRFIQVPTTLLAQVDSSVGGKTGVNHAQGKNLIGAFHQPAGVLIDTNSLTTLPEREYAAGLAEVIKYGVILDGDFFDYLEARVDGLNNRDPEILRHVIARSCQLKAQVVTQDERETTGLRAVLNYGHTFGHAFEALTGYGTLLHGEAVAIGMICASRLAEKLGRISAQDTQRQIDLLSAVELPTEVPKELKSMANQIIERMLLDKKTVAGSLRFVLPDRIGHVETVRGVAPDLAVTCL